MTGDPETHGEISLSLDPEDSTTNTAETKGGNPPPPRVNRVRSVRRSKNGGSPGSSIVVEPEVQAPAPPAPPADPVTARSPPPPRPLPPKSPAARKGPMIKAVSSPEFKDPAPSGAPSRSPRSKTPLQVRKEAAMAAAAETEPTKPLGEKQGQSLSAPLFSPIMVGSTLGLQVFAVLEGPSLWSRPCEKRCGPRQLRSAGCSFDLRSRLSRHDLQVCRLGSNWEPCDYEARSAGMARV